jgi:hypothetical protein
MSDKTRSAERLKTPGSRAASTQKLPSVRPPTRAGGSGSQKINPAQTGNSNPNYTEREQEKLMSKWRVNVSRSRLCESAKCSFGGWRCPECVKEIVFGHCLLFEEMEGQVNKTKFRILISCNITQNMPTSFRSGSSKSGKFCRQITACAFCWQKVMFAIRKLMSSLQNFIQRSNSRRLQCKRCTCLFVLLPSSFQTAACASQFISSQANMMHQRLEMVFRQNEARLTLQQF